MKNYYKLLEVEENASDEDIKKSYRNLSKKYHPDLNPQGAEQFKEINEAYEVLSNKEKRKKYDFQKSNPYNGSEFSDFFASMFSNQNFQQPRNHPAPDKILNLQLTPLESYLGQEKNIQYFRELHCDACVGTGGDRTICGFCEGTGFILKTFGTGFLVQQVRMGCPNCEGRGYNLINKCYKCSGKGTLGNANEIKINIPKGIDSGQFVRIRGMGDYRNGNYGDLLIQIDLKSSGGFEKMGSDLVYNLYLSYEDLLKDKYSIPHPDGELIVPAPKNFDTSKPLRLRGKGYSSGDMFIKIHVKFDRPT